MGGLGNQMFQYAVGRSISLKLNLELKFDLSFYDNCTDRKYDLNKFRIFNTSATNSEIENISTSSLSIKKILKFKILRKPIPLYLGPVIRERMFNYDQNILKIRGKKFYLDGYWQSEKYFSEYKKQLHHDFTLLKIENMAYLKLKNEILNCNSVGVHIRRGDYVNNPITNKFHGVCSEQYYYSAIESLKYRFKNPVLFVFSDDLHWVKTNLDFSLPVYYIDNHYNLTPNEEILLMSSCRHNIISNSSFSWWGAWLNENIDKIVIAPKKWFNTNQASDTDIIPNRWIRI
jgi:hypothetical protein